MVQKHIVISMIAPVAVAGILIMTILAATANAQQENNNTGNAQQPVAGCGPGTDNSTCSSTTNQQPQVAPTAGCSPGTDNSTCPTTSTPSQTSSTPTTPTSGCGPGTDNSTCPYAPPTPQPTNMTKPTNSTGNTTADLANGILAVHNRERAAVGVPPLVWSEKLAADAKVWAEHLATIGQYVHDYEGQRTLGEGENLASFVASLGPFANCSDCPVPYKSQGQAQWVAEKALPGLGGHYTQMVWNTTKAVGCGTATAGDSGYLVCRYSPPGNIIGQKPY